MLVETGYGEDLSLVVHLLIIISLVMIILIPVQVILIQDFYN